MGSHWLAILVPRLWREWSTLEYIGVHDEHFVESMHDFSKHDLATVHTRMTEKKQYQFPSFQPMFKLHIVVVGRQMRNGSCSSWSILWCHRAPDWYNVLMVSDVPGNTFQIVSQLPQSRHTWKEWTRLICLSTNRENELSDRTQNNQESGSLKFNILFYTILRLVCFVCFIMWGHALHTSENTRWHLKKKPLRVTLCSHLFSLCITARQISKDFWNISLWMKNANHFQKSFFYFVVNFKTDDLDLPESRRLEFGCGRRWRSLERCWWRPRLGLLDLERESQRRHLITTVRE